MYNGSEGVVLKNCQLTVPILTLVVASGTEKSSCWLVFVNFGAWSFTSVIVT